MKTEHQRGFAAIETAAALALVVSVVTASSIMLYTSFAKIWLEHSAYEGSICLSTPAPKADCERRLRKDVEHALPIGHIDHLEIARTSFVTSVAFSWSANDLITLKIRDRRDLPLEGIP